MVQCSFSWPLLVSITVWPTTTTDVVLVTTGRTCKYPTVIHHTDAPDRNSNPAPLVRPRELPLKRSCCISFILHISLCITTCTQWNNSWFSEMISTFDSHKTDESEIFRYILNMYIFFTGEYTYCFGKNTWFHIPCHLPQKKHFN